MEAGVGADTFITWFQGLAAWLWHEVFTPGHMVDATMQVPALVCTGFGSWWIYDFIHPALEQRIEGRPAGEWRRIQLELVAVVLFPAMWAVALWTYFLVTSYLGLPNNLIWIGCNLLFAWIVIRLICMFIRDPLWARVVAVVAYTVAVLNILALLDPTIALLDGLAMNVGELRVSALTVIKGMVSLGVLLWAAMLASGVMEQRIQQVPQLTPSVRVLIGKLFKATLVTVAVIVSLTTIGIDLTALAVFSGAVGVGIGFGLQKVVANLISGIIILMDKSIKPGDIIKIGDSYGWVSSLGARYISVETRDSTEFLIPNEDIITQQVVNWSHKNPLARIKVQTRVSYDTDVRKALKLMVEATKRPSRVLSDPAPRALVTGFGEGPIELELRFWIRDVQNGIRNISSDVMLEIWDMFRANGIVIPPPQRTVHIDQFPAVEFAVEGEAPGARPPRAPEPAGV